MSATSEYILLFRGQDWDTNLTPDETRQMLARLTTWMESVQRTAKVKTGQPLERTGNIVSGKNGRSVTDGPFTESKEAIGGYLLIEATSIDDAIAIAQSYPPLEYGISIEIRPTVLECPINKRQRERDQHFTVTATA